MTIYRQLLKTYRRINYQTWSLQLTVVKNLKFLRPGIWLSGGALCLECHEALTWVICTIKKKKVEIVNFIEIIILY
jgi:hypothetical protein